MNYFRIVTTDEPELWSGALRQIGEFDFYHTPQYHRLAEMRGEGKAYLLALQSGERSVALPLLVREIDAIGFSNLGVRLKDATSVYGYAGPVSTPELPEATAEDFFQRLQAFCDDQSIVSVFSRLHPIIDQTRILAGQGEIAQIGHTVSIDLAADSHTQTSFYRSGHRYQINQLKKKGMVCEELGPEHLNEVVSIYTNTMERVRAEDEYFFDRSYFAYLM